MIIVCILCLKCTFEGIYRNWVLDILENIFLVNLITVSAVASYIGDGEKLSAVTETSIGIAFLMFIVILSYHTYKYTVKPRCQKWLISVQKCLSASRTCKSLQELSHIAVDGESTHSNPSDTQPNLRSVQPHRLTFDENKEPILVIDEEN